MKTSDIHIKIIFIWGKTFQKFYYFTGPIELNLKTPERSPWHHTPLYFLSRFSGIFFLEKYVLYYVYYENIYRNFDFHIILVLISSFIYGHTNKRSVIKNWDYVKENKVPLNRDKRIFGMTSQANVRIRQTWTTISPSPLK